MYAHATRGAGRATHVVLFTLLAMLAALAPSLATTPARADEGLVNTARSQHAATADWILANVEPTGLGKEWPAIGLARSRDVDATEWLDTYYANLVDDVVEKAGNLGPATTYERTIIALSAMGKDVTDVGGYNLLTGVADMSKMGALNSAVFGLIALDSGNYSVPEVEGVANPTTRQKLVDRALALEISGGGWAFFGSTPDPDMTGMTLQALAPYTDQPAVAAAVERGIERLSMIQQSSGGFSSYGNQSAESTTQVILALTAHGVDPVTDPRFIKEGGNPVSALTTYFVEGGGFWYSKPGPPNGMSTEQGFYGLTDFLRFVDGMPSLYDIATADPVFTTTGLTAVSAAPGQVSLTAAVTGTGAAGTVSFTEAGSSVGDVTVVDGAATLQLDDVVAGEHTYLATFAPLSSAFRGSVSEPVTVTVEAKPAPGPFASTTAKPTAKVGKKSVTVKVKVTGSVKATGKVRFTVKKGKRGVVTRTVKLNARGVATIAVTKSAIRTKLKGKKLGGVYTVNAKYLGSSQLKASTGKGTFRL